MKAKQEIKDLSKNYPQNYLKNHVIHDRLGSEAESPGISFTDVHPLNPQAFEYKIGQKSVHVFIEGRDEGEYALIYGKEVGNERTRIGKLKAKN